jgi:hypothetical protein
MPEHPNIERRLDGQFSFKQVAGFLLMLVISLVVYTFVSLVQRQDKTEEKVDTIRTEVIPKLTRIVEQQEKDNVRQDKELDALQAKTK